MINRAVKKFFAVLAVLSTAGLYAAVEQSNNLFITRAVVSNSAREAMMSRNIKTDGDGWTGSLAIGGFYQGTWDQDKDKGAGAHVFWSGKNKMTMGAADAAGTYNLDPWHMGLGMSTGKGDITLKPKIFKAGANFVLGMSASANEPGFFARVHAPVVYMSMDPVLTETKVTAVKYPATDNAGTINAKEVATTAMYADLTQAFVGDKTYGDVQKMAFGQINGKKTATKFGDIDVVVGYNFMADEDKQFGFGLRVGDPSGNTPDAVSVLEPVVGRGGNWAVGGHLCGNVNAWEGGSGDKNLKLYLDAHVMTLLKKKMNRSYDLKSKGGSKYMLVASYSAGAYQSKINNLINLSTLESESSMSAMGDVALGLCYCSGNWSADLGYNGWGHSTEKLTITGTLAADSYKLLSRAATVVHATPANATTSPDAEINKPGTTAAHGNTAFIAQANLDVDSAKQQSAFTSKLFGGVGYNWNDSDYCPHIRLFGEFEYSHSDNNALPSWAAGVEGGVSF